MNIFATIGLGLMLAGTANAQTVEREYLHPWEPEIGYAGVVRHGDKLYLSGIVAEGETMEVQMTAVYAEIGRVLAARGLDSRDIIKETVYTRDIEATKTAAGTVRKAFYKEAAYPSASWVQIERLYTPEALIEIEVEVALRP